MRNLRRIFRGIRNRQSGIFVVRLGKRLVQYPRRMEAELGEDWGEMGGYVDMEYAFEL